MNAAAVQALESLLVFTLGIARNRPQLPDEPCILIANHNSALDTYVLANLLTYAHKRRTRVVAAQDTFAAGLLGWFAKATLDTVLVARRPRKGVDPLAEPKALLQAGKSLVIYPEGTRGEPGEMAPFRRGIGLLADAFPDLPIYPVYIHGVERCLGRSEILVVPFQVRLVVDEAPLRGRDFREVPDESEREHSARIALALENRVRSLGGLPPRVPPSEALPAS